MNRTEIAATKCENRFKPKSSCKGSCHLTKQLKADEQQQDSPYSSGSKEKFEVLLYAELNAGRETVFINDFLHHHDRYTEPSTQEFPGSVFHPPAFA